MAITKFNNDLFDNITQNADAFFDLSKSKGFSSFHFLKDFLNKCNFSIKEVFMNLSTLQNSVKRTQIFQNARLRQALVKYAKANNETTFLFHHLDFLCTKILNDVSYVSMSDSVYQMANALEAEFQNEGRKLSEIFKHPSLVIKINQKDIFKQTVTHLLNNKLQSKEKSQNDFTTLRITEATQLGREHAKKGGHLVFRLNLQDSLPNLTTLKKATLIYLRKNHPDHNPNGNQDLAKDATQLLELINQGTYKIYDDAYKNAKLFS